MPIGAGQRLAEGFGLNRNNKQKNAYAPHINVGCKRLIFCGYSIKPLGEITSPLSNAM